jgi:hypothetical protein
MCWAVVGLLLGAPNVELLLFRGLTVVTLLFRGLTVVTLLRCNMNNSRVGLGLFVPRF